MKRFLEGGANPLGFVIQEGWGLAPSKEFFSFRPKLNIINELFEILVSIGLILLVGLMVTISHSELSIARFLVCFIIYLFYVYKGVLEIFKFSFIKTLKQWHSCEHKVINVLEEELDPTLENLRNMSSFSFACGSQGCFVKIASGFAVCLLLIFTKINLFLCLGIGVGIWFILCLVSDKINFPTQHLTRKEPTHEQYEEALRVAREFLWSE